MITKIKEMRIIPPGKLVWHASHNLEQFKAMNSMIMIFSEGERLFHKTRFHKGKWLPELGWCKIYLIKECNKQTCRQGIMMMWSKLILMNFKRAFISMMIIYIKKDRFMIIKILGWLTNSLCSDKKWKTKKVRKDFWIYMLMPSVDKRGRNRFIQNALMLNVHLSHSW